MKARKKRTDTMTEPASTGVVTNCSVASTAASSAAAAARGFGKSLDLLCKRMDLVDGEIMGEKDEVVGREQKRVWKWKEEGDFERKVAICGDDANAALAMVMASYPHSLRAMAIT